MKLKCILFILTIMIGFTSLGLSDLEVIDDQTSLYDKGYSTTIENWTVFQFVICPGVPGVTYNSAVYGLKIGVPMSGGIGCVGGVEMSLISSTTSRVYGVQMAAFVNIADQVEGVQLAAITNATDNVSGLQMSMINVSGNASGVQFGLANVDSENLNGCQAGIYNYVKDANGLQFGIINVAKKSSFQFGLINIIEDGWMPFFPLINFSY